MATIRFGGVEGRRAAAERPFQALVRPLHLNTHGRHETLTDIGVLAGTDFGRTETRRVAVEPGEDEARNLDWEAGDYQSSPLWRDAGNADR